MERNWNPLLTELKSFSATGAWLAARQLGELASKYAMAVPDENVLETILRYGYDPKAQKSRLIEIGAGAGYWAKCLEMRGADILAFDLFPPDQGENSIFKTSFSHVLKGDPQTLLKYPDRTLFLCWPDNHVPMAEECLRFYSGRYLLYVGVMPEEARNNYRGLSCATAGFFKQLDERWQLVERLSMPCFAQVTSALYVFERR